MDEAARTSFPLVHSPHHAASILFQLIARATNGRKGIQIFLAWDDRLCLRLNIGWLVEWSQLVHVLKRPLRLHVLLVQCGPKRR